MPSSSPAQARLMAGVAHNPEFAAKVGIPQSVGEEFNSADAGTGILSEGITSHNRKSSRNNFHKRSKLK